MLLNNNKLYRSASAPEADPAETLLARNQIVKHRVLS